jgi:transposase
VPILAERLDSVVISVDTHLDTHTAALLSPLGAVLGECTVAADAQAATRLLTWADGKAPGAAYTWVVEGSRSYGVGLLRQLRVTGQHVAEAPRVKRADRRGQGKSDSLDAVALGRAALACTRLAEPRGDGPREMLRVLLTTRRHHSDTRTATVNLLKALIVTADEALRAALRGKKTPEQVRHLCTQSLPDPNGPVEQVVRDELVDLARRIHELDQTLHRNRKHLATLVAAACPDLLAQPGVGPVTGAVLLAAWSHRGRARNEAAFAALAGTNPIPASSGKVVRHRLNRGGDRQLNSALHTIALTRRRVHAETRAYVDQRTEQGRTRGEINRCLKRYLSRKLFRIMEATANLA